MRYEWAQALFGKSENYLDKVYTTERTMASSVGAMRQKPLLKRPHPRVGLACDA